MFKSVSSKLHQLKRGSVLEQLCKAKVVVADEEVVFQKLVRGWPENMRGVDSDGFLAVAPVLGIVREASANQIV